HHPLRKRGRIRAGPRSQLVERHPPATNSRTGPIDELGPAGVSALRIEKVHGDRAGGGPDEDGQSRGCATPGCALARRPGLLANLRVQRFVRGGGELTGGISRATPELADGLSGTASELLCCAANPVRDLVAHVLQVNSP